MTSSTISAIGVSLSKRPRASSALLHRFRSSVFFSLFTARLSDGQRALASSNHVSSMPAFVHGLLAISGTRIGRNYSFS
jgi:hypothetical protein